MRNSTCAEARDPPAFEAPVSPSSTNWKRRAETNGAYGCLGDLGMHALHLPLRARWAPLDVSFHLARTPYEPVPVSLEMAELVSELTGAPIDRVDNPRKDQSGGTRGVHELDRQRVKTGTGY